MDNNNWRPTQGEPTMDTGEWRSQLQPDGRQRIVNKLVEYLKKNLPISSPEGLYELRKIAIRIEEKIYAAAASQADYLRKLSLKMLAIEQKSQTRGGLLTIKPCVQIQPDGRQRIVNKLMDTLKKNLPISGPEGLQELRMITVRFEEKIYASATSQADYLRKLSLKMLAIEQKSQTRGGLLTIEPCVHGL